MKMEQTECSLTLAYKIQMPGNYPPMKMEQTECSLTLAYKIQIPGNYPEESKQRPEHGKSSKSRINYKLFVFMTTQSTAQIIYMISEVSSAMNIHFQACSTEKL